MLIFIKNMWIYTAHRNKNPWVADTGERYLLEKELEKARIEAVRAHEELKRAGPVEELKLRLATLEAAINTTSQELQWRSKAMEELAAVIRCAELAEVAPAIL